MEEEEVPPPPPPPPPRDWEEEDEGPPPSPPIAAPMRPRSASRPAALPYPVYFINLDTERMGMEGVRGCGGDGGEDEGR